MEVLIWPALALLVFAVLVRTGKRRDRVKVIFSGWSTDTYCLWTLARS